MSDRHIKYAITTEQWRSTAQGSTFSRMSEPIPCIRADEPGASNERLRALVTAAEQLAGTSLAGTLVSIYEHAGFLFVSWRDPAARETWSRFVTQALHDSRPGTACNHLVPGDQDVEYDEHALESEL